MTTELMILIIMIVTGIVMATHIVTTLCGFNTDTEPEMPEEFYELDI